MNTSIPSGYRQRADGSLVPESMVSDIDKLRDQTIERMIAAVKEQSANLARLKGSVFADVESFVAISQEQYGVRAGGKKGNVTLTSYSGRYKVVRQVQERLTFDERLQAAKALIDECIMDWSEGSRDEIKVLVNDAFRVDQEGQINTGRVLGLRRLEIKDEKWQRAMTAISDSVRVDGSKPYIRFYERAEGSDEYVAIPLDFAAL
ncbi:MULTISPECIES: DUF3164 family protein [Achromobacter]|uniref:DUF3164 family protein n=1 Tax=Achromobacter TaxID=222 RepID=UPI000D736193|nr:MULTISPECIES: DUF3164 family protein [Achromobacter]MCH4573116.1 DUF3164 family protein [Achromobacter xylosoxidans]PWY53658.1 sulfate transporter [Achromobacter sp. RW408]